MKRRLENNRTPDLMNLFILFYHDVRFIIVVRRILNFRIFSGGLIRIFIFYYCCRCLLRAILVILVSFILYLFLNLSGERLKFQRSRRGVGILDSDQLCHNKIVILVRLLLSCENAIKAKIRSLKMTGILERMNV